MTTDPKRLPGADPHTGQREVDPVTGYDTTGHDWGGIRELNTPFPKIALVALAITVLYSLIAWVLLPAWPIGRDYTRGLLGLDQGEMAREGARAMASVREDWLKRFAASDLAGLAEDADLMARAMPAAERLFLDNCAVCHGAAGGGNPGYPVLADAHWLWGGDPAAIAHTLAVGINASHPDTRQAEMPAFDWMDRAERLALADHVAALPSGEADHGSDAAAAFEENCAACHGERGAGGLENGAPSLADGAAIYGQNRETVLRTLSGGRRGVMPSWSDRLSGEEINLLALYVAGLGDEGDRQ